MGFRPNNNPYSNENVSFDLKELDDAVMNELLSQLKENIIPVIVEELSKVELPEISEEVDTGKVSFGVKVQESNAVVQRGCFNCNI